jgi:tricarballylate dehydrogenase
MIERSKEMLPWISAQCVRFQPSLVGTLRLGRTNSFFLGGDRAILFALYRTAKGLGVTAVYEPPIPAIEMDGNFLRSLTSEIDG